MKKILSLVLTLTVLISVFNSCSKDDDENNLSSNSNSRLIGTWGTKWNGGGGIAIHPKFTFLNNNKVKYYTYPSGSKPELEEIGTWS